MVDLTPTIQSKSDQINSDDLVGRSLTIKITKVAACNEDNQPINVHYEGENGKPYRPCKSMRRVMAMVWGPDGKAYAGQRLTLYRDPSVKFGKDAVGGIRISHMSGIDEDTTVAFMVTRGKKAPYTVKPLRPESGARRGVPAGDRAPDADGFPGDRAGLPDGLKTGAQLQAEQSAKPTLSGRIEAAKSKLSTVTTTADFTRHWGNTGALRNDLDAQDPDALAEFETWARERADAIAEAEGA